MGVSHIFYIVQMLPNRAKRLTWKRNIGLECIKFEMFCRKTFRLILEPYLSWGRYGLLPSPWLFYNALKPIL